MDLADVGQLRLYRAGAVCGARGGDRTIRLASRGSEGRRRRPTPCRLGSPRGAIDVFTVRGGRCPRIDAQNALDRERLVREFAKVLLPRRVLQVAKPLRYSDIAFELFDGGNGSIRLRPFA